MLVRCARRIRMLQNRAARAWVGLIADFGHSLPNAMNSKKPCRPSFVRASFCPANSVMPAQICAGQRLDSIEWQGKNSRPLAGRRDALVDRVALQASRLEKKLDHESTISNEIASPKSFRLH